MRQKVAQFLASDIIRNSAKLLTASVIVQIVGLLVYPILTRLYTPEDFGLINLFLSISGFLALIATAEFQYAILLPEDENKAVECFHLGFFVTLGLIFLILLSIPFSDQISNTIFNTPQLADWYWAIPIFVFLSATWTLLNYWYTRKKLFGQISRYQVNQCLSNALAKCGFGFCGFSNGGLIISAILSPCFSLITSIIKTGKQYLKPLISNNDKQYCITFHEYSNFPKYSLPRALINFFSSNLPIFILTPFFGLSEIGYFGMAITLAFKPITMISSSLYQVLFQKTTEMVQKHESIKRFYLKLLFYSTAFLLPAFFVLFYFLPEITTFLLGKNWQQTGIYINTMMSWLFIVILTAPIAYLPDIFQKQKIGLFFELILIAARILALFIGIRNDDFLFTISLYSSVSTLIIALQLIWFGKLIHDYERGILQ